MLNACIFVESVNSFSQQVQYYACDIMPLKWTNPHSVSHVSGWLYMYIFPAEPPALYIHQSYHSRRLSNMYFPLSLSLCLVKLIP